MQSKLFPAFFRLQVIACSLALAALAALASHAAHTRTDTHTHTHTHTGTGAGTPAAAVAAVAASPQLLSVPAQLRGPAAATQLVLLAVAVAGWLSNLLVFEPVTTEVGARGQRERSVMK